MDILTRTHIKRTVLIEGKTKKRITFIILRLSTCINLFTSSVLSFDQYKNEINAKFYIVDLKLTYVVSYLILAGGQGGFVRVVWLAALDFT